MKRYREGTGVIMGRFLCTPFFEIEDNTAGESGVEQFDLARPRSKKRRAYHEIRIQK
jgi:hypothetical protein